MYRFLSNVIHFVHQRPNTEEASGPAVGQESPERRRRRERDEVAYEGFLQSTTVGAAVSRELQLAAAAASSSASFSSFGPVAASLNASTTSVRSSASDAARRASPRTYPPPLQNDLELVLFHYYVAYADARTRTVLDRVAEDVQHAAREKVLASWLHDDDDADKAAGLLVNLPVKPTTQRSAGASTQQTPSAMAPSSSASPDAPHIDLMPARLLAILLERWHSALRDATSDSELVVTLRPRLAMWCVVLATHARSAGMQQMLEMGLEDCLLSTLTRVTRVLFSRQGSSLVGRDTHSNSDPPAQSATEEVSQPPHPNHEKGHEPVAVLPLSASTPSKQQEVGTLELLLHLLLQVYCPLTDFTSAMPSAKPGRTSTLTNEQLMTGDPRRWVSSSSPAVRGTRRSGEASTAEGQPGAPTVSHKTSSVVQEAISNELEPLLMYLAKGALSHNVNKEPWEDEAAAYAMQSVALVLLHIRHGEEEMERMASTVMCALSILLARFSCDNLVPASLDRLLRQLTSGMLIFVDLLRSTPSVAAEAMNSSCFVDNLVLALQRIGREYPCAVQSASFAADYSHSRDAVLQLTSLDTLQRMQRRQRQRDATGAEAAPLPLPPPAAFAVLADSPAVDEFLHSYLGVLQAAQETRSRLERNGYTSTTNGTAGNGSTNESRVIGYLDQLELVLARVFLSSLPGGNADGADCTVAQPPGEHRAKLLLQSPYGSISSGSGYADEAEAPTAENIFCPRSCLYDLTLKYAIGLLNGDAAASRETVDGDAGGGGGGTAATTTPWGVFERFMSRGLFRVLFHQSVWSDSFCGDDRLLFAEVIVLLAALTRNVTDDTSTTVAALSTPSMLIEEGASAALSGSFPNLLGVNPNPGSTLCPTKKTALPSVMYGRKMVTVCAATLVHALHSKDSGLTPQSSGMSSSSSSVLCTALLRHHAFPAFASWARVLGIRQRTLPDQPPLPSSVLPLSHETFSTLPRVEREQGKKEKTPAALPVVTSAFPPTEVELPWATQLLADLVHDPAGRGLVLAQEVSFIFSLLPDPALREGAQQMLVELLCFQCDSPQEYATLMAPLSRQLWHTVSACSGLADWTESVLEEGDPLVLFMRSEWRPAGEKEEMCDAVLLAVLDAISTAVHRLGSASSRGCTGAVYQLQHVLCDVQIAGDCLVRLVHRVSQPWQVPVVVGLSALLDALRALVQGNPVLRRLLFYTIAPEELVECFRVEWLTAEPQGCVGFVRAFVHFAYEEDLRSHHDAYLPPLQTAASASLPLGDTLQPARSSSSPPVASTASLYTIQSAEVLTALVRSFAAVEPWYDCHTEALTYLLRRLLYSMTHCRASLFLASSCGLFDALSRLVRPLYGTPLQDAVRELMVVIASHHIDVRQVKQYLTTLVHVESRVATPAEQRARLAPVAIAVLSAAAQTCLRERNEPHSYIAFRGGSGQVGIKAPLHEFPQDGYTVSMWLRLEAAPTDGLFPRTIFSLQNTDRQTVLELRFHSSGTLSVVCQDVRRGGVDVELGCSLPVGVWVHVTVMHRPTQLFLGNTGREFQLWLDGREVAVTGSVRYPASLTRGFCYVGARGEDVERQCTAVGLVAQVTAVYFFDRALSGKEAADLYSGTSGDTAWQAGVATTTARANRAPGLPSSFSSARLAGPQPPPLPRPPELTEVRGDVGVEKHLADQAVLCIDPRLSEQGHLYNLSALLRGRPRESRLIIYEGTLVCNTSTVLDAVCVLGALQSVVMPLLTLLVNPELPFSALGRTPVVEQQQPQQKKQTARDTETSDVPVREMIQLIESLVSVDVVRAAMVDAGLFVQLAYVLQQLGPRLTIHVPNQLMGLCRALLAYPVIFEAAYSALFLSDSLVHACPPATQLVFINTQRILVTTDEEARQQMRALGAQLFVVAEMVRCIEPDDAVNRQGYGTRQHREEMLVQLFNLLEALTVEPITMSDATPLYQLLLGLQLRIHRRRERFRTATVTTTTMTAGSDTRIGGPEEEKVSQQQEAEEERRQREDDWERLLVAALQLTRRLLFSRSVLLAQFLGRKDYIAALLPLLSSPFTVVRQEAVLQLVLLVTRSKRTQELLNPTLQVGKDVVHVARDVSLAWLKDPLQQFPTDLGTYMALRCGLVGDFGVDHIPAEYTPLTAASGLVCAPVLTPLLTLLRRSGDRTLKKLALADLAVLLNSDPQAWRRLLTVPAWYVLVVNLYLSEQVGGQGSVDSAHHSTTEGCHVVDPLVLPSPAMGEDTTAGEEHMIYSASGMVLSCTLYHALLLESYGGTELDLVVTYMGEQHAWRLLNRVLCGIADRYRSRLLGNVESSSTAFLGLGSSVALTNFTTFVNTVEDVLFYSAPANPAFAARKRPYGSSTPGVRSAGPASTVPSMTSSPLARPTGGMGTSPPPASLQLAASTTPTAVAAVGAATVRTGYTEWEQLSVVDAPDTSAAVEWAETGVHYIVGTADAGGDGMLALRRAPDHRWLHQSLALKTADLLTTTAAVLNHGGAILPGSSSPAEVLFPTPTRYRKGGFLRIFARLLRTAAQFTLQDPLSLDAIVLLLDRYVRLVDNTSSSFLLLKRVENPDDCREHSPVATSMTLLYCAHELLVRRLRSAAHGGSVRHPDFNAELVDCLRCLVILHKKSFEQMHLFALRYPRDSRHTHTGADAGGTTQATLQWLCDRRDSRSPHVVETFADVASREDYNTFIERCLLATERAQQTDKALPSSIASEHQKTMKQLQSVLVGLGLAKRVIADGLIKLCKEKTGLPLTAEVTVSSGTPVADDTLCTAAASTIVGAATESSMQSSMSGSLLLPSLAVEQANSAVQATVWARFLESTKGTIWNVDPAGQRTARFVKLADVEQQPLVRRKLVYDRYGTDHAAVTVAMGASSAVTVSGSGGKPDSESREEDSGGASLPSGTVVFLGDGTTEELDGSVGGGGGNPATRRLRLRGGEAVLLRENDKSDEEEFAVEDRILRTNGVLWRAHELGDLPFGASSSPVAAHAGTVGPDSFPSVDARKPGSGPAPTSRAAVTPAAAEGTAATAGETTPSTVTAAPTRRLSATTTTTTTTTAFASRGPAPPMEEEPGGGFQESDLPALLAIPCEVPYMMHCWSASFTLRGPEICVLFDEENSSYNQPVSGEARPFLVRPRNFSFSAGSIVSIAPGRRFRMKRTGIEVWLRDRRSYFLNFVSPEVMRVALEKISAVAYKQLKVHRTTLYVLQENPIKEPLRLRNMLRWQERDISNFDYLLWLNVLGGRSVNDLTQYPVFPWVIADYTSDTLDLTNPDTFRDLRQPIGVCGNEARRELVRHRYDEMKELGDVPSHYFTHYSSPAVTLYYLVRLEPYTTLQILLQGGHFDHADRMFHSMQSCFRGVTTSTQDVRELIPEMYYLPELCVNHNGVRFGVKQDGAAMDHLQLPPWAGGSPHQFIYIMREALESDYVSSVLHHWIDLVFGCKQRGKEAIEALNVFNWHSYEELDKNRGPDVDEQLLIDSLDNIGQTPIQLFRRGHCARRQREVADALFYPVNVKAMPMRWGCSRVALVSLLASDRVLVVSGTGAAVTMKTMVRPLRRAALGLANATTTSASSPPACAVRHPSFSGSAPPSSPPPPQSAPPAGAAYSTTGSAGATSTLPAVASSASVGTAAGGGTAPHGFFEEYSFDVSEEYESRIVAMPPGVVPNASTFADGPCTPDNSAVLCFGADVFVALGGLFDHSVVLRPMSGVGEDVRLLAHRGRVVRLATSGDSRYMVSGAADTTFVVWGCRMAPGRHSVEVELLFTVCGHEDNPTAVDVSSTLDLVATASADGVLMLHTLSTGSLERTWRHPKQFAIDRVLLQARCYVPNVLYASNVDYVVHQASINGTVLRSFVPPGRITSWCATPSQHFVMSCVPYHRATASMAVETTERGEDTVINPSAVVYVHSFYLTVLKSVALPAASVVHTVACHPRLAQVVAAGTADGTLLLLRSSRQQSLVL